MHCLAWCSMFIGVPYLFRDHFFMTYRFSPLFCSTSAVFMSFLVVPIFSSVALEEFKNIWAGFCSTYDRTTHKLPLRDKMELLRKLHQNAEQNISTGARHHAGCRNVRSWKSGEWWISQHSLESTRKVIDGTDVFIILMQ